MNITFPMSLAILRYSNGILNQESNEISSVLDENVTMDIKDDTQESLTLDKETIVNNALKTNKISLSTINPKIKIALVKSENKPQMVINFGEEEALGNEKFKMDVWNTKFLEFWEWKEQKDSENNTQILFTKGTSYLKNEILNENEMDWSESFDLELKEKQIEKKLDNSMNQGGLLNYSINVISSALNNAYNWFGK